MALISCAECNSQVSDKAAACPKCGAPIASIDGDYVTTQQTGKLFKGQMAMAAVLIIIGFFLMPLSASFSGFVIVFGLVWLIAAKLMSWWEHG